MATPADVGVGIDVAKAQLDVAVEPTGATWTVPRSQGGLRRLQGQLQALRPTRIVLEASGGYEWLVVETLAAVGLPVVRVNPRQTHDFARALGTLAKTDRIDAQHAGPLRGRGATRRCAPTPRRRSSGSRPSFAAATSWSRRASPSSCSAPTWSPRSWRAATPCWPWCAT